MTLNDLDPVLIDVDGRPWWSFPGGELLPVVSGGSDPSAGGGSGDGGGEGGQGSGGNAGSGDGGQDAGSGDDSAQGDKDKGGEAKQVTMTQAELDELINKRVAKATKASETAAAEKAAREKLDETERLKAEKADADKAAAEATTKANARLVLSDAKVAAIAAGVTAERVDRFMKLVDLGEIDVGDDGNADAKAVRKAVDAALKDVPEFKATPAKGGSSGGDMNGDGGKGKATSLEDAIAAKYAG